LRIGILGAARIARQFVAGAAATPLVRVVSVAARDPVRADAFARENAVPGTHPSYEAMLADPEVDAIYIPLPNGLHAPWAIRAADTGKHVICEKPLATSLDEARAMFAAARRNGTRLVEAYPYLAQAQTQAVRRLVADGAIGRPRLIRTTFGVPFADMTDIRFDPALGGGSALDAGSYAVSMALVLAGGRPIRVVADADWAETGVDRTMIAMLRFADGLMAQVASSFATAYHRHAHVAGETGAIETSYLNHPPLGGPPTVVVRRGATAQAEIETITLSGGNGFTAEIDSFARMVLERPEHWTGATEAQSLDIAATLDAILASARSGQPVDVAV
jgi:predicted dehydrogenase